MDYPVGVSFIGSAWSEKSLLEMAYAFEQFNQLERLNEKKFFARIYL
ncbi:MAG: hypothetical protein CM15mP127_03230 [Gammaproteobacteria bacterium]|nr:MAG: hypothetical protein CM15mP127_03230 [Gammaproteobacteria bacterium]